MPKQSKPIENFEFRLKLDLRPFLEGRSILTDGICSDGTLIVLATDQPSSVLPNRIEPVGPPPYMVTAYHFGDELLDVVELKTSATIFCQVQRFIDKSVLVYSDEKENTSIYSPKGDLLQQFSLGAADELQVSGTDEIWAGYGDMTTCGAGIALADGVVNQLVEAQASGLACFNRDGSLKWAFNPAAGFEHMVDFCVLNVSGDAAWTCYYPGLPVTRISADKTVSCWRNEIGPGSAIAVSRDRALLFHRDNDGRARVISQRLGAESSMIELGECELKMPEGSEDIRCEGRSGEFYSVRVVNVHGRGDRLHVVAGARWYEFGCDDFPGT